MEQHIFKKLKRSIGFSNLSYDEAELNCQENNCIPSLGDMAARITAKHFGCDEFEKVDPPMDELLLRKVAKWAFPQNKKIIEAMATLSGSSCEGKYSSDLDWRAGKVLLEDKKVREMWQVGFMATAYIMKSSPKLHRYDDDDETKESLAESERDIRVSLTFEKQEITSSFCSDCNEKCWCRHVVAAVIYRIENADSVPIHAPVTEILSTLNRDQLQKLLQYAIYGDPAGVLGKVFKYVDTIRDSSSDINKQVGAPDPTFGAIQNASQWEVTKTEFEKSPQWIPRCIHHLLDQINTLQKFGKNKEAVELYMILLPKVLKEGIDARRRFYDNDMIKTIQKAVSETCQSVTCFMISDGIDKQSYEKLSQFLHNMSVSQKIPQDMNLCDWVRLPPISMCFPKLPKRCQNVLQEPIATKFVDPWHPELKQYLNGNLDADTMTYDENVIIMLARLQSLFQICDKSNMDPIILFIELILKKLAKMAFQHSILSQRFSKTQLNKYFDIQDRPQVTNVKPQATNDCDKPNQSKGKTRRKRKIQKVAEPVQSENCVKEIELQPCQISYALLHCLHLQDVCIEHFCVPNMDPQFIAAYCWLALELSRFRTYEEFLKIGEMEQLDDCENTVIKILNDYYIDEKFNLSAHLKKDIAAGMWQYIYHHGFDFYKGKPPVRMIDAMLTMSCEPDYAFTIPDHYLVTMIHTLLLDLPGLYNGFFDKSTEMKTYYFIEIIGFIFKKCHEEDSDENFNETKHSKSGSGTTMLCEIVMKLQSVQSKALLLGVLSILRKRAIMLKSRPDLAKATLCFLCHMISALRESDNRNSSSNTFEQGQVFQMILSVANLCKLESLEVLAHTKPKLQSTEFVEVLMILKPYMHRENIYSPKLSEVINLCLTSEQPEITHNGEIHRFNLSLLLDIFPKGSEQYKETLQMIVQYYHRIDYNTLFEIVCLHESKNQVGEVEILDDILFDLVDRALIKANLLGKDKGNEIHQWAYAKCIEKLNLPSTEPLLTKLFETVTKCCNLPDIVLFYLENKTVLPENIVIRLPRLNDLLISGYHFQAKELIHSCNSMMYTKIIAKIQSWRSNVKDLLGDNFVQEFDTQIFSTIGKRFSTKKKLISMLNDDFPHMREAFYPENTAKK